MSEYPSLGLSQSLQLQQVQRIEIDQTSTSELNQAKSLLMDQLLGDYLFDSPASPAHAMAAILHPFVRNQIDGPVPLYVVESSTPGTGKSMFCELVSIIAGEKHLTSRTLPTSDDEIRKWITTMFHSKTEICLFDHFSGNRRLRSESLLRLLTTPLWSDRLLGTKQIVQYRSNAVWFLTGDNPQIARKFNDCIVRIRIKADCEQPWCRTNFKIHNLKQWARDNREELANAANTLIRAWEEAGKPNGKRCLGNSKSWSRVMGGILEVAKIPSFLSTAK